jgi:hypothetical protein
MSHLDILLPFGFPPSGMAADLTKALNAPSLATLIARAKSQRREAFDAFARALPHETWLARQFGLANRLPVDASPPIALAAMHMFGLTQDTGLWFMLNPVHLHVARDHLVLTGQRQLELSDQESRTLFEAARPLFEEAGKFALYGDARNWFLRADAWNDLQTATPDATRGHNIDIWMPHGPGERDWRKLLNEIQMAWHAHPVNTERQERGLTPVNSIWLWGGAPAGERDPREDFLKGVGAGRYDAAFNLSGSTAAFSLFAARSVENSTASTVIAASSRLGLVLLDDLIEPALGGDWSEWLARFRALDAEWFTPLLGALKGGKIDHISLIMTHGTQLSEFITGRQSLRKFWATPSLAKLLIP